VFQPDLSPNQFLASGAESTLAVGRLDKTHEFPRGETSEEFHEKLAWLCTNEQVQQARGFHLCDLCPPMDSLGTHGVVLKGSLDKREYLLGTAEIRVRDANVTFAAPNLVLHYVVDHAYLPPEGFVRAVLASSQRLQRSSWTILRGPYWETKQPPLGRRERRTFRGRFRRWLARLWR
jgi:hypothetical protein